jgi:hypothetical protein
VADGNSVILGSRPEGLTPGGTVNTNTLVEAAGSPVEGKVLGFGPKRPNSPISVRTETKSNLPKNLVEVEFLCHDRGPYKSYTALGIKT